MADSRPIGVFDSGVGGLTVLREIHDRLPSESTIYLGDLKHFPYGPRYPTEVRGFAFDIIRYLQGRDVKLVVIACNTATAAALSQARETFDVPIVGRIYPGCFQLVDSASTTAEKVRRQLEHANLLADGARPQHEIVVTSVPERFNEVAEILFGERVPEVTEVDIWEAK